MTLKPNLKHLLSKKVALSVVAAIILVGGGVLFLHWRAQVAAQDYKTALQAHFHTYDTKINAVDDKYYASYDAILNKKSTMPVKEYDKLLIPASLQYAQAYQPYLVAMRDKQPKLASVPFGSHLSGAYRQATDLQSKAHQGFASNVRHGESTIYYDQHYYDLLATLKRIEALGSGVEAQQEALQTFTQLADDQGLSKDQDIRQKLADLQKQGNSYVDDFKKQVAALPLPPEFKGEKHHMYAVADNYKALQNEMADAYAKGDAARMKAAADKLQNHPKDYDFLSAAIAPFQDIHKLYSPFDVEAYYYNQLAKTIKSV